MAPAQARTMLIPVETLNREFDGKLLLALLAAERGWRAIVGSRTLINERLPLYPRSIYMAKAMRSTARKLFAELDGLGHRIVAFDEESLVRISDEMFLKRLESRTLAYVRLLFAWGEDNAAIWRRSPAYAGTPITCTGNPRVDLLRPDLRDYYAPEIANIRSRFGDFALLNSNFSLVNHYIPTRTRFKVAEWVAEQDRARLRTGILGHKGALFDSFIQAIPEIARAIAPNNLVVRPHPSESPEPWLAAAAGISNVHVIHEGSVVPWLAAARVLLQNGCTSAVEAAVIGTPALAYRPVTSPENDIVLPNSLSTECFDLPTLLDQLREIWNGGGRSLDTNQRALLEHHITGTTGTLCGDRMLDAIDSQWSLLDFRPKQDIGTWISGTINHQRRWLPVRLRRTFALRQKKDEYLRHKFPGISDAYIAERIARFARTLGRFKGLRAKRLSADIYEIVGGTAQ
jgi:surface carbohydrate biosynthesis protein